MHGTKGRTSQPLLGGTLLSERDFPAPHRGSSMGSILPPASINPSERLGKRTSDHISPLCARPELCARRAAADVVRSSADVAKLSLVVRRAAPSGTIWGHQIVRMRKTFLCSRSSLAREPMTRDRKRVDSFGRRAAVCVVQRSTVAPSLRTSPPLNPTPGRRRRRRGVFDLVIRM